MALLLTFSSREHKKLTESWREHYKQLRLTYEPTYRVSQQLSLRTPDNQPLLLTSWANERPTIMPPADIVAVILHDPSTWALKTYLIEQPELLGCLGPSVTVESFPTRFFQIEEMTEIARAAILSRATWIDQRTLNPLTT